MKSESPGRAAADNRANDALRFRARLMRREAAGSTTFFRVPDDVMKTFAPSKRVPVTVTIDGHRWRSTVASYGSDFLVPVRSEIRAMVGVTEGDFVDVELSRDEAPRSVNVPSDLQAALDDASASAAFASFAYSHQNEFVRWIEEAKAPQTRATRIAKTVERTKLKAPKK